MANFIKIVSLEYSGSTLLDIILGNLLPSGISLGEVQRSIEPDSSTCSPTICSCGDQDCSYWSNHHLTYSSYVHHLSSKFPDTLFVDSSKTLSSVAESLSDTRAILLVYRACIPWSKSCLKRYFRKEVSILNSSNKLKMIVPFLRIEIFRRLILPLPLEWFLRNLRISFALASFQKQHPGIHFCAISFEDVINSCSGYTLTSQSMHIKRGNRMHQSSNTFSLNKTSNPKIFLDYLLEYALSRSLPRTRSLPEFIQRLSVS